jgi:hypothetical protein
MNHTPLSWSPRLVHGDENYVLGYNGPLFAVIWRNLTTVAGARHLSSAFHEYAKAGRKHGLVTVIEADAPLPESDARDAIAEFLNGISEQCVVSAVIFEGAGFRSAAVRAVVTGLTMLARQAYPHRVFASLEEAAPWYVQRAPDEWGMDQARFLDAIAGIRRSIDD